MILHRSSLFIALVALVLSCGTSSFAAPGAVVLDAESRREIRSVRGLARYGIRASCLRLPDGGVAVGALDGDVFTFVTPRSVERARRRAFKRKLAAVRARCGRIFDDETAAGYDAPPIPLLAEWEERMRSYGLLHCAALEDPRSSYEEKLLGTYYDAEWVFLRISAYRNEPFWNECARRAQKVYGRDYVLANDGAVPAYWSFSHGLTEAFLRFGDREARDAVRLLAHQAAYASDETRLDETRDSELSREVAYTIMAYLNAERLGEPRRSRLSVLVKQALGHIDQWFVSRSAPYVRPFMVGLTAQALISYAEATGDGRVLPALRVAADGLWRTAWIPSKGAFMYTDRETDSGGREPAADLNLLIAPLYGWLYHKTGETLFLERGDRIFAGGVRAAFLGNGKQFNQSYRWSFDYVGWRNRPPLRAAGRAARE